MDLVELQVLVVEEYQRPEEVQEFGAVVLLWGKSVDDVADYGGEFPDLVLVVEHVLVIVVHLFEEIDGTHVELEVVLHWANVFLDLELALLVVDDEPCEVDVAHVEEFGG